MARKLRPILNGGITESLTASLPTLYKTPPGENAAVAAVEVTMRINEILFCCANHFSIYIFSGKPSEKSEM